MVVTGAHGFVAGSVLSQAGADWQVHTVSRGQALAGRDNLRWHNCDPLAPGELARLFNVSEVALGYRLNRLGLG